MGGTAVATPVPVRGDFAGWQQSDTGSGTGRFLGRRVRGRTTPGQQDVSVRAGRQEEAGTEPRRGLGPRFVQMIYTAVRRLNPLAARGHAASRQSAGPAGGSPVRECKAAPADDRVNSARIDQEAERAVQLLEAARTRSLCRSEQRELVRLTGSARAVVSPELLNELRSAVERAKAFDQHIARARQLLDKADSEGLSEQERRELYELRRSTKRAVNSVVGRNGLGREKLDDPRTEKATAEGLLNYLQLRFVDRGSILVEHILPRMRQIASVESAGPVRPGEAQLPVQPTLNSADQLKAPASNGARALNRESLWKVARHRDEQLVVVLDGDSVRAVPEESLPRDHDAQAVVASFKQCLKETFRKYPEGLEDLEKLEAEAGVLRTGLVSELLLANELGQNLVSNGVKCKPKRLSATYVGAGPRTSASVCADFEFMERPEIRQVIELLERHGAKFEWRTTIVEQQGPNDVGRGNAWQDRQEGTMNTGAEMWGYEARLKNHFENHYDDYIKMLQPFPPALAMFLSCWVPVEKSAQTESELQSGTRELSLTDRQANGEQHPEAEQADGAATPGNVQEKRLLTDRAVGLRSMVGREEQGAFENQWRKLENDPWLKLRCTLELYTDTTVEAVNVLPSLKANLQCKGKDGKASSFDADLVRMNTGTSLGSPLTEEQHDLNGHCYVGPMCREGLGEALGKKQLLDDRGRIKEGVRILTGGSGLSLYDQLLNLDSLMGLTEADSSVPKGWKVTDDAKQRRKGSIVITSATDAKWISPRHSHSPAWTQDLDPISNLREQHALFLHGHGEEIYKAWQDICIATVAAASGVTPREARHDVKTTEELLNLHKQENDKHFNAAFAEQTKTMYGARREAFLGTTLGMSFARDPNSAVEKLGTSAPLTYKGRSGYVMHRAQLSAITNPDAEVSRDNRKLLDVHVDRFQDVTSSPAIIQSLAKELIDAGIAVYTPGSYRNIKVAPEGSEHPLVFTDKQGKTYNQDFFVVSPTFKLTANKAETSLAGQVTPLDPVEAPHIARTSGSRKLLDKEGVPTSIENFGIASKGIRLRNGSTIGMYAYDVNNRESAVQVVQGLRYRRAAEAIQASVGRGDPIGTVERMYRDALPEERAYRAEAEGFRADFESAMYKAALMRKIEKDAGEDPAEFRRLYKRYLEVAGTKAGIAQLGRAAMEEMGEKMPEYAPPGRDDYFDRFVDAPDHIHQEVFMRAVREAVQIAGGIKALAEFEPVAAGLIRRDMEARELPRVSDVKSQTKADRVN